MKYILVTWIFVYAGTLNADNLKPLRVSPLPETIRFLPFKRSDRINDDFLLQFNSLSRAAKLSVYSYPKRIGYTVEFDILATNKQLNQGIIVSLDHKVSAEFEGKLYSQNKYLYLPTKMGSQRVSLLFVGFSEIEVLKLWSSYQNQYALEKENANFYLQSSILELILPPAYGQDQEQVGSNAAKVNSISSEASDFAYALGDSFSKCGLGIVEGLNAVLVTPFVDAGKSLGNLVVSPKQWVEGSGKQLEVLWSNLKNFDKLAAQTYKDFRKKSPAEKSRLYCNFAGASVGPGLALKSASTVSGSANRAAGSIVKAKKIAVGVVDDSAKVQPSSVTAGVVTAENIAISSENLVQKVSMIRPTELIFVKDAPTLAYKIKSARFEDIPEKIRSHLGQVDKTTYTPEYLEKNIGSVIALQLKGAEADFYIIGKETFSSKYKSVAISEVEAKNGKYMKSLDQVLPDAAKNEGVVAVLKTTPTKMIKMSELGYKVDAPVTIESPWGHQTKPAGKDAFLVWDESQKKYYMVNTGSDGLPLSYIPQ